MDDHPTSWSVVLPKVQKKVAIWLFIVSGLQGKQLTPEGEIKRSFAAHHQTRAHPAQAFKRTKSLQAHECAAVSLFA
jgi:hypothetical protein